jgi:hypothetical protein
LLRQNERLCCINLDGHLIYRYDISGFLGGLAVDQQGHVYIGGADDIHRLYTVLPLLFIMNSFVKSLLNVIPRDQSTPSCLLNTISRNVPSGDNLCMSSAPPMYNLSTLLTIQRTTRYT